MSSRIIFFLAVDYDVHQLKNDKNTEKDSKEWNEQFHEGGGGSKNC